MLKLIISHQSVASAEVICFITNLFHIETENSDHFYDECRYNISNRPRPLPSKPFPIRRSSVLEFEAVWSSY
jgi:hypothetical protein